MTTAAEVIRHGGTVALALAMRGCHTIGAQGNMVAMTEVSGVSPP